MPFRDETFTLLFILTKKEESMPVSKHTLRNTDLLTTLVNFLFIEHSFNMKAFVAGATETGRLIARSSQAEYSRPRFGKRLTASQSSFTRGG